MAQITKKLTPRQERFVEEYLIDLNATQAAVRAGYSKRTAQEQGSRLLSNVMVQTAVQKRMDARSKRTEITSDAVLGEIMYITMSNLADAYDANGKTLPLQEMPEARSTRDQTAGADPWSQSH